MAEDSFQEKTEAPTPKRRQEAHEKGEVPRSQEVTTAFILLAGAAAITGVAGGAASAVADVFGMAVSRATVFSVGPDGAAGLMRAMAGRLVTGVAPLLLVVTGAALIVSAVQARGVVSVEALKPKWSRLDPIQTIPQVWGWKAPAELVKNLLKLVLVGVVVWKVLGAARTDVPALAQESPVALLQLIRGYAGRLLLWAGLAYLIVALADYAYQVWQHEKKLKMSKEDVRKELKDAEGDQVVKVRRRTMARQLARRRMLLAVREADVVVTNPTHIAVALKYDPDMADAPVVLAMGERKVAERIKELARASDVPMVENRPLARALFATGRVGQQIPVELFVAVAEILAWVYGKAGYRPEGVSGRSWQGAEA